MGAFGRIGVPASTQPSHHASPLHSTILQNSFFSPCPHHSDLKKCEVSKHSAPQQPLFDCCWLAAAAKPDTRSAPYLPARHPSSHHLTPPSPHPPKATLFCVDCDRHGAACAAATAAHALCQHCAPPHAGHRTIQIRRYVYCDVVRAADIAPFVDVSGIQHYTVNQAKVVFLTPRPQAKLLAPGTRDGCAVCRRALREGCTFCSLACRVQLLQGGDAAAAAWAGGAVEAVVGLPDSWVASDSSDCGTTHDGGAAAVGLPPQQPRPAGGDAPAHRPDQLQPRPAKGSVAAAAAVAARDAAPWGGKRHSDSSCFSHLDWHASNGHVCRRKQVSPRRSPLL